MTREILVAVLGFMVALLPHLGIPSVFKNGMFIVCGISLIVLGMALSRARYLRSVATKEGELHAKTFRESNIRQPFGSSVSYNKEI